MKKGDRVSGFDLAEDQYIKGTIVEIYENDEYPITVEWDNGAISHHTANELSVITEDQPSFDRTAIATKILSGMMPQRQTIQIHNKKEEIVAAAIELTDELIKQLSE